jgi:hypothetical protein
VRWGVRFHGGRRSRVEDELLITGQEGRRDGRRRLIDGRRRQWSGIGQKEEAPSQDSWGNLVERTDDGRRVSRLKSIDIWALMHDHRVAARQSERQDHPKITPGNIGSGTVVVLIHVVRKQELTHFFLNANFMPKNCGKGGNCIKNCKECAEEGRSCERREPGVMQPAKVTATASPWFLGEGKNLVVRK